MKLTETPEYKNAVFAAVGGDLETARKAYLRLIDQAEAADDTTAISHFMQSLADVEARDGNFDLAHELHLRAIGQSPGIPLAILFYAKSLVQHFGQPELAEAKLHEAEQVLGSARWDTKADNIAIEDYHGFIAKIRDFIRSS